MLNTPSVTISRMRAFFDSSNLLSKSEIFYVHTLRVPLFFPKIIAQTIKHFKHLDGRGIQAHWIYFLEGGRGISVLHAVPLLLTHIFEKYLWWYTNYFMGKILETYLPYFCAGICIFELYTIWFRQWWTRDSAHLTTQRLLLSTASQKFQRLHQNSLRTKLHLLFCETWLFSLPVLCGYSET